MLKSIKIDYDLSKFLEPKVDYSIHKGTCLSHQVHELTDIHKEYGLGDTYDEENTVIQQLWYTDKQIDFKELGKQLGIEIITISSILQPPGNIITLHRDTFYQINKRFPNDERLKVRANIYLEDWKVGHLIQYQDINDNNKWKTSDNWKAGEGYLWSKDVLHLSANAGMKPKFTLQISGFLLNK
jgi:hypothetical protein